MMMYSTKRTLIAVIKIVIGFRLSTNALPVYERFVAHGRCPPCDPSIRDLGFLSNRIQEATIRSFDFRIRSKSHSMGGRKRFSTLSFLFSSGNNNNVSSNDVFASVPGWFTRKNFLIAGIFLLIPPILLEAYSRIGILSIPSGQRNGNDRAPRRIFSYVPPPKNTDWSHVEHATIVFHGAGGEDSYTNELMKRLDAAAESSSSGLQNHYNHIVDWSQNSANILQASYNGQQIGRIAARELLEQATAPNNSLKTIHFIGISVGAFSADAAVNEVKKNFQNSNSIEAPFVQLTLLDPFQQLGIFGVSYGNKTFGKSADYAQQYLNTDDSVPSTNKPLQNTVCYDVTNLRPESVFGHDWPLVYYARSDHCGKIMINDQGKSITSVETGTVVVL
ncbi:unnamed protein product [Pseudo-nitzschia multistriata]|uniref:Uncharacterized protein n=1 Tax=Pseudo-nitzschia multistriata TaxID=183589 RepID=A0A448Z6M4_9STRA|nr:unnamed protein product [Pseudo-nitzschia multistriata]